MTSNQSRQQTISKRIEELTRLLDQWEEYRLSARDPNEALRSEKEIERIKGYLAEYQHEMAGNGQKVVEDTANPVMAPTIRKVNRQWIMGIAVALLLMAGGYYAYSVYMRVEPDYSKYLNYLTEGDKLLGQNKFAEASAAYQRALDYNPQDSAATKKISLLKQADRYIKQDKFTDAQQLFQLIVNIPASSGLSVQARSMSRSDGGGGGGSSSNIQVKAVWDGQTLVLTISGGAPYDDPSQPYVFDDLNCSDCIQWSKEGDRYVARLDGSRVSGLTLNLRDRAGNSASGQVPERSSDTGAASPNPTNAAMKSEQFKGLVESADKYFAAGKYSEAQKDYMAAQQLKPGDAHVAQRLADCEKKLGEQSLADAKNAPRMNVPSGTYTMGYDDGNPEDRPEHSVALGAFKISKTEVTVGRYKAFCKYANRPMPPAPPYGWNDDYPMSNVTWEEAQAFCEWVGGRLPTEAEWEYAAREGGGKAIYSGGNQLDLYAIYRDNSGGRPSAVGRKRPNGYGLYDMTGNVSEWCADWYGKYTSAAAQNPKGASSGKYKIVRGGAYNSLPNSTQDGDQLRATYRNSKPPGTREPYLGFRVVWAG